MKCDEAKPACGRCTSTGRRCDGYVPTGVVQLSVDVPGDYNERRGYHFFRLKSIGEILGQQDADFWKSLFLQSSYTQPAIKHALIAVASVHESLELSEGDVALSDVVAQKKRAFSLKHYNKAIQLLIYDYQDSSNQLSTALVMCVLFIVFEVFSSNYPAGALHLQNGLALLDQWSSMREFSGKSGNDLIYSEDLINNRVAPILVRCAAQAATFADRRIHAGRYSNYPVLPFAPVLPPRFDSFIQAREALDNVMTWTSLSVNSLKPSSGPETGAILARTLEEWRQAFSPLLKGTETKLEHRDFRAARCMQIHYIVAFIVIDTYLSDNETVFDKHIDQFRAIVDEAQELLFTNDGVDEQYKLSFSFDFGITPPLYFTASRCRDPLIRRRALALMRLPHRAQGPWNNEHSAKCAEEMIRIEEVGDGLVKSCEDVPEKFRLRKVSADVQHENGCIKMVYVHAPYDLKTPLKAVYIPLRTYAVQCRVAGSVPSGTTVKASLRRRPCRETSIAGFISKTYFPQDKF